MPYFHFSYFFLLCYTTALPPKRKIKPLSGLKPCAICGQGDTLWSKQRTTPAPAEIKEEEQREEEQLKRRTVQCKHQHVVISSFQMREKVLGRKRARHAHRPTDLKRHLQQVFELFFECEKAYQALILLILGE